MNLLHPLSRTFCKLLGIRGETIDGRFIGKNNQLVLRSRKKYNPENVLLLLPHCLQDWECPHRINADIHNCHACGKCRIAELIQIGDAYGVAMRVVGGGSAARRAIMDSRPSFVLAVACERDLISGIKDSLPLPVMGILNERPNGPCKNTTVDIGLVREALELVVEKQKASSLVPEGRFYRSGS